MICSRCVMDLTDPDITFDSNGICNHCIEYAQKEKQRKVDQLNFPWIIHEIKQSGRGRDYDCLLGLSGGVDSSLCLHYLVENGLRPLCFSVDNGWNTPESDENIMRLVEGLKVPFYRYTINVETFRKLQTAFIQSQTANIEIPTDHMLMAASYEMAKENNIKWIISGGNLATEAIMPKTWGYNARDLKFIRSVYTHFTKTRLSGLPTIGLLQYLRLRFLSGMKIVNLLDYYEYRREDAKKLLSEKYGWKDYGEKHYESKFTQWFQAHYLPFYFGYDKRRPHYSSLINSGQMTREEALAKLQEPLTFPEIIKLEGAWKRKTYKDYPNSEFWWNLFSKIYGYLKRFSNHRS